MEEFSANYLTHKAAEMTDNQVYQRTEAVHVISDWRGEGGFVGGGGVGDGNGKPSATTTSFLLKTMNEDATVSVGAPTPAAANSNSGGHDVQTKHKTS